MTIGGNGIVTRRSPLLFRATVSRLEQAASALGAQLFGRIDHAANAKALGKVLEPTELLMFGRPDVSWPLMRDQRTTALDLPLKILVGRDNEGVVWLRANADLMRYPFGYARESRAEAGAVGADLHLKSPATGRS